jgi:hypothetical protein
MKRSAQLASLSRDHHFALLAARSLSRADTANAADAAERFIVFMADEGLEHFLLEESVLVPFVPDEERGRLLIARMVADHEYFRDVWRRLRAAASHPSLDLLHELGGRLRKHVRMEETELFPYLEDSLEPSALQEIADRLGDGLEASSGRPASVVIARRFLDAFIARDVDGLIALSHPAVDVRPLRLTRTVEYAGHEGLRKWLEDLAALPRSPSFAIEELEARDGDVVAARVCVSIQGEARRVTAAITVEDALVREVRGNFSDEDTLKKVGAL